MEEKQHQTRGTVIKNMIPSQSIKYDEHSSGNITNSTMNQQQQKSLNEQYLLPKRSPPYLGAANLPMGFGSDHLLLPPILTFAHLAFPTSEFNGSTGKSPEFFQTYPPLFGNFDNLKQTYHQHRSTVCIPPPLKPPHPIPTIISGTTPMAPKTKKPKFDFSIKALTSKDEKTTGRKNNKSPSEQDIEIHMEEEERPSYSPKDTENKVKSSEALLAVAPIKNRGRPSADSIELLKQKSLQNPHRYSCPSCGRSFPRKKSLDTHKLTHSDVKPYACDFPGCQRKFKQSGQLKTHLRLHTGEKPFKCTFPLCESAFTHANRKCSKHPGYPLQRTLSTNTLSPTLYDQMCNDKNNDINVEKVKDWFQRQFAERESKISQSKENKAPATCNESVPHLLPKKVLSNSNDENCKRLLSAVALVELRDQNKNGNNKKENFEKLFSINNIL